MNKKVKAQQLHELLDRVIEINEQTDMAAWFNLSGHVNHLTVTVASDKRNYTDEVYYQTFYLSEDGEGDKVAHACVRLYTLMKSWQPEENMEDIILEEEQ